MRRSMWPFSASAGLLAAVLAGLLLCSCGPQPANFMEAAIPAERGPAGAQEAEPKPGDDTPPGIVPANRTEADVLDYAGFLNADGSEPVCIESFLQEKETLQEGRTRLFLQDEQGAYEVFGLACTPEEYEALTPGRRLRIRGYKTEFAGRIQITDATAEALEGEWFAEPVDVTAALGTEELKEFCGRRVEFRDLRVEPMFDGVSPYFTGWDNMGSEEQGSDLYFTASCGEETCAFLVNAALRGPDSGVYQAVQNLQVGQSVHLVGILSWYNGPQPLVTELEVLA